MSLNIIETVREIVAESLYIEKDEVTLNATLMKDLGAESIDFLDIMFRLEKSFGIKLPRGEIEKRTKEDLTEEEFAIAGVLQPKGLQRLAEVMPEIDRSLIKEGLKLRDIPTLYTVGTFVKLVENHLNEKTASDAVVPAAGSQGSASTAALA